MTVKLGTDILKVEVPPQLRVRRMTGMTWFDQAIGGGFTPSTVMMVTGKPGAGKSTLVRQLADSVTRQGHIAVYNTGEESLYQVKMRVEKMDLRHGFKSGEEGYAGKLLAFAREVQGSHPRHQVFLFQDSLQKLDDGHYKNGTTSNTPVRCCELLKDWAKETYGIVVFIGQVTKSGQFAGKNEIKHAVDAHLELLEDEDRDSPTFGSKVMTVSKNRFGPDGIAVPYRLDEKGLHAGEEIRTISGVRRATRPDPEEAAG
jgi:DNA repair protein RadA/Sms